MREDRLVKAVLDTLSEKKKKQRQQQQQQQKKTGRIVMGGILLIIDLYSIRIQNRSNGR